MTIKEAAAAYQAARVALLEAVVTACPGPHRAQQHRDMLPPWCHACGRTDTGYRAKDLSRNNRARVSRRPRPTVEAAPTIDPCPVCGAKVTTVHGQDPPGSVWVDPCGHRVLGAVVRGNRIELTR